MHPPDFWFDDSWPARALEPFGRIYGAVTTARASRADAPRAGIPVISVGGLTVGGAGKTPVTMSVVRHLLARGRKAGVVLRGYGGRLRGPVRVDPAIHTADDVGDEALLHAAHGPTWVAKNRFRGVRAAQDAGLDVAVLDDGHQTPGLHKDLKIVVINGRNPFGNGRVFPAGPLRENPADGLARADAVVMMGEDATRLVPRLPGQLPVLRAHLSPDAATVALRGRRVVAFAGIGDPEQFFDMLRALGAQVLARHPFEDHQAFGPTDIGPVLDEAFSIGAIPVTTAKDAVRLLPDQRQQVNVAGIEVKWDYERALDDLLRRIA
ncbi:MAG: tetraacyldisaccharide 4'-kinase [Rhodospirillaceae bacterium]|nr:tetraacyldisaccharide 4'-kinase [Rhodospirillaceae bacterium]